MDTKSEIIKCSVALFNKKGFFNVSVNDIANSMRISPGNFTYHFKRKEHLLSTILDEILESAEDIIMPEGGYITLEHFEDLFGKFLAVQKAYSFFFLNMPYLLVEYPEVMSRYKSATSKRLFDARRLVDHFIVTNRLIEEKNDVNYDILIQNLWMVNTFWSASTLLLDDNNESQKHSAINALWSILIPYLTDKGYQEYQEIIQYSKKVKE